MDEPVRIWIDGDGCPVIMETRRIAARHGVSVTVVAGPGRRIAPPSEGFEQMVVSGASEAADDAIASQAGPGDVVITDDLPLSARCLRAGVVVISSRGVLHTEETIGSRLAQRELGKFLRELGQITPGPAPYRRDFRSRFKMVLHEVLERLKREATRESPERPARPER